MRRLLLLGSLMLLFTVGIAQGQENVAPAATPAPPVFTARVDIESAFVRALPDFEAEVTASLFQNDRVEVISRSLTGLWFEVRRPYRLNNLGWVYHDLLDYDFRPEDLPLGDLTTGVLGPTSLTYAPAFGAYTIAQVNLRDQPSRRAQMSIRVPALLTLPVLERNQDGSWLRVHYRGHEGWIAAFLVRRLSRVMEIPEAAGLPPPDTPPVVVIPVEIQQAQIDRLREFIGVRRALAYSLEIFWWAVFKGETMPCNAPEAISHYPYGEQDVRELPELGRYVPQLRDAVNYLNQAREPLLNCGVISPDTVYAARNAAINAKVAFDATSQRIDVLERDVVNFRRPRQTPAPPSP
jgi:hypothetical protein